MDIRVCTDYPGHPKTIRLVRLAGVDAPWAFVRLWLWAALHCPDGDLSGLTDRDIERLAGWRGKKGALVAGLTSCMVNEGSTGYLAGKHGARVIHDWAEHQPWISNKKARSAAAKRAADARWSMRTGCGPHAGRIAPAYAPSPAPDPDPKSRGLKQVGSISKEPPGKDEPLPISPSREANPLADTPKDINQSPEAMEDAELTVASIRSRCRSPKLIRAGAALRALGTWIDSGKPAIGAPKAAQQGAPGPVGHGSLVEVPRR